MSEWIDPVILSLGPIHFRWYGAMYVLSFIIGAALLKYLADKKFWPLPPKDIDQFITYLLIGMFLGARAAYVLLYNWEHYSNNFLEVFAIWKGGLSFHGAVLGMCLATWLFARKKEVHFLQLSDCLALAGTPGLFLGRMGNFINGELYGRVTDSWIGIVFPEGGPFPRHPSQIYEGVLEGIILFCFLFFLHKRQQYYGFVSSFFLLAYGVFRFFVEFFREPDIQMGYFLTFLTLGQILSLLMIPLSYIVLKHAERLALKNPLLER